jgi:aminoglycoside phosphotransferase family enzyme/predicted kinase
MLREHDIVDEVRENQRKLVQALRAPACYPHPVGRISIIETHISFVVLTGTFAYKIKKPVDLGFLDFTTLEKRRFFCEEELRLNSRLAPQVYLAVVPIGGTHAAPKVGEGAAVIEYAVKMREFPQEALADRMLARGQLTSHNIDALAERVAEFHHRARRCPDSDDYGTPQANLAGVAQNFAQIRAAGIQTVLLPLLGDIEKWTLHEHERRGNVFAARKRDGWVRECHGDLHLGNIAFLDGDPCIFDCIEFNPGLRWIDVMNEAAFLVMDLRAADRSGLATRFLNTYLEFGGDYGGLCTLRYFLVYRAMVRAKVGLMRALQLGSRDPAQAAAQKTFRRYLEFAKSCANPHPGFMVITHGFSGSGKTTLSQSLVELTGAIRIRSDVERKRMHAASVAGGRKSDIASGLYSADVTDSTYRRLLELAESVLESGYGVIVDATFLKRSHRDRFCALAKRAGVPFSIVDFSVGEELLRSRIGIRLQQRRDASDADLGVLAHQLATHEPLQPDELSAAFAYDASRPADDAQREQSWMPLLQRLGLPSD